VSRQENGSERSINQGEKAKAMSKILRASIAAVAILAGVSTAAMAAYDEPTVPDRANQYSGYAPNSQEGIRAFWDNQADK
jgi:hypothetical protein